MIETKRDGIMNGQILSDDGKEVHFKDAKGKTPGGADTTLLADGKGVLRLNGYKFYSTGTLFADLIAVSATDAEGRDLQAIVPVDRAGVELFDDWEGFGQRTTAVAAEIEEFAEFAPFRKGAQPVT